MVLFLAHSPTRTQHKKLHTLSLSLSILKCSNSLHRTPKMTHCPWKQKGTKQFRKPCLPQQTQHLSFSRCSIVTTLICHTSATKHTRTHTPALKTSKSQRKTHSNAWIMQREWLRETRTQTYNTTCKPEDDKVINNFGYYSGVKKERWCTETTCNATKTPC